MQQVHAPSIGASPESVFSSVLNAVRRVTHLDLKKLKIASWVILILAGVIQGWYTRHLVFNDGISYLDIARYYAQGNWHAALNSYWSPLYSWLIALLLVTLHPSAYWQIAMLHIVNFIAYVAALVGFELFLGCLVRLQKRVMGENGVSEQTVRVVGYSVFLIATLLLIGVGYNSPDMVAMAIGFFITYLLLKIEAGTATGSTCISFGALLALEYLARAAFAPFIILYAAIAGILLRARKTDILRPVSYVVISAALIAVPFVLALSISKGRFTIGDAGKLNYAWEVAGAPRSIHWQGEPYDLGKPLHPTHKVLDHPAIYTFASPVPGTYPPWYEPSYWYAGIAPHIKWKSQLLVLRGNLITVLYFFVRSPVVLPVFLLIWFMGWRVWLSRKGIVAYWFLWFPALAYIGGYVLVYADARYIAGSFVLIWLSLLTSVSVRAGTLRLAANATLQALGIIFAFGFLFARLSYPALVTASDLVHLRESEPNLTWIVAQRFKELGLHPGDRIAWIGEPMEAEWPSLDHLQIVAEIPVLSRRDNSISRRAYADKQEINAFWSAPPEQKARVFDAFRQAGAKIVVVDRLPKGVDASGWHHILLPGDSHRIWRAQFDTPKDAAFRWLSNPGS